MSLTVHDSVAAFRRHLEALMATPGEAGFVAEARQDRVELPMVQQGGVLAAADWERALAAAAALLDGKRAFVLASPMLSNEALFLLQRLVQRTGGAGAFRVQTAADEAPLPGVEYWFVDGGRRRVHKTVDYFLLDFVGGDAAIIVASSSSQRAIGTPDWTMPIAVATASAGQGAAMLVFIVDSVRGSCPP
mgnify:CR=1 FL=1